VYGGPKPPQGWPSSRGCSSWEDPHLEQSQEAPYYRDKQMLHMQEEGGVRGPSSSPLRCGFCFVVFSCQSLWLVLGYATTELSDQRNFCFLITTYLRFFVIRPHK
jgi:hypothetical protein